LEGLWRFLSRTLGGIKGEHQNPEAKGQKLEPSRVTMGMKSPKPTEEKLERNLMKHGWEDKKSLGGGGSGIGSIKGRKPYAIDSGRGLINEWATDRPGNTR